MSIYFPKSSLLLLLTPKTGSMWIRKLLTLSNIEYKVVGPNYLHGHDDLKHHSRGDYKTIASFVRHPLTWHYSYWQYRENGPSKWNPKHLLFDKLCMSKSFHKYLLKVIKYFPNDMMTLYNRFTGTIENPIDFIGKQEFLSRDFLNLMETCNITISNKIVANTKKINVGKKQKDLSKFESIVYQNNIETYERFNYGIKP